MDFKSFIAYLTIFLIYCELTSCVPMGDVDDERDVNFLINKIKDVIITKEELPISPSPVKNNEVKDALKISSEKDVIKFDSNGDSIETEKAKAHKAGGCKAKAKSSSEQNIKTPTEANVAKTENVHHDKSSSIDDHAIRYDHRGNSFEEYKDSDEHHDHNELSEEAPKRKKKAKKNIAEDDGEDIINLNHVLNDEFINKQINNRKLHDEGSLDTDEEDEIPLITIPMYDIIRQYQRMQQGFISETEEYSEETTHDIFADPHLKNILKEISEERKAFKIEKKDGQKVKPAAKRVFERHLGASDESL